MSTAPEPRRRSYWLLVVFAVFLLTPARLAPTWLIGGAALTVVIAAALAGRRGAARRAAGERARHATMLGSDHSGHPVLLDDRQLSAHGLILGASGAGKTTTLLAILSDHVARGRPVVAIDMKGSPGFAAQLARATAAASRPFGLWTPDGPGLWNPLAHGNPTELKDKLIATERFTEPHYQRAAERYVQTALQVLRESHPERPATLDEVVAAMDPRRLSVLLRALPADRAARVHDYLAGLTPDQHSAIRGLGTRLAIISESHAGRFLSSVSPPAGELIDLQAALAGEQVVLFSLNSSTYGKLGAQLGTLAVQDLVATVGRRLTQLGVATAHGPGERAPAIIGIDEFSALGADNVISLLARGREAGASVLLATQELADLDRAARGLRDQVLGNTAVKIAHRQDVPSSAQTIAEIAGTVTRWEETRQTGGRLFGSGYAGRGTRRQVERFAVHPNEIKTLGTGEAVVIVKEPRSGVATVRVAPAPSGRVSPSGRDSPSDRGRRSGRDGPVLG